MQSRRINWDDEPLAVFKAALAYIRKKSPQNADKVKEETLERIAQLSQHPEMHPPDKWKEDNDRQFRAFDLHRFRIS